MKNLKILVRILICSVVIISCESPGSEIAPSIKEASRAAYTLENALVRFSVDEDGRLLELVNKESSTNYAGGGHFWRLIYQDGVSLEEAFNAQDIHAEIQQDKNELTLVFNEENNPELAFNMIITVTLEDDDLNFDMVLENKDESHIIRECQFPFIRGVNIRDDYDLFLSSHGGHRYEDVEHVISIHHTNYIALDNKEVQFNTMYPGPAAMNFFVLGSETEGLYIASHDTSFQVTNHYLSKFAGGGLNCAMIKYPFMAPGEKTLLTGYVLSPYSGSWHVAAKKYRAWADSWYSMPVLPEWIKDLTSWQRIIMRHQYGKTLFRYDQMEEILQDGLSAGIKTLFMFGWHAGGHDSEYPDYSPDEEQGGKVALKENIEKFQAGGGQVILYFNGRLIDMASDYYKEEGAEVCIKRPDGSESNEFYKFGAEGTALRLFGNKSFVTACPSVTAWQEILKGFIDQAVDLGCDGVFFDQLGFMPSMCFDKNHGHKVPFTNVMKVNADNLEELRQYTKSLKPDMGFGIEWISDLTSQHVDFVHTVCGGAAVNNNWRNGEKPKGDQFLELFYYTFPEVIITDREIRDDSDIERRVNFAILKGQRSDVEIYRCRATIAETPRYQAYLAKANALREKYGDIILKGLYSDSDFFEIDNPEFFASSFIAGNQLAVIVSQSHLEHAEARLKVPGYKYIEHDGLNDYTVKLAGEDIRLNVKKHGLVVLLFELR